MTHEEAIAYLKSADVTVGREIKTKTAEALEMAIKALEQKSKSEWEHDHEILKAYYDGASDILDKIRAEIEALEYLIIEDGSDGYDKYVDRYDVLKIIDKHKADNEEGAEK